MQDHLITPLLRSNHHRTNPRLNQAIIRIESIHRFGRVTHYDESLSNHFLIHRFAGRYFLISRILMLRKETTFPWS